MKKFVAPELDVVKFEMEDVLTESGLGDTFDDSNVGPFT